MVKQVEKLPLGTLIKLIHNDGSKPHTNVAYTMEELMQMQRKKTKSKPKIIKCPRCGEMGRVNAINRTSPKVHIAKETGKRKVMNKLKPEQIRYIVTHEKLPGSWGYRVAKRRRCCIISQQDRDYVLKKLGRYIEPVKK